MLSKIKSFLFTNHSTGQTIAKNTFWLFFGQILSRLIRVIIVVYGARILGVSEWGAFSYALGFAAFFTTFVDFGINAVITRESLHDIKQQERYFGTALFIKGALLLVIALALIIGSPYFIDSFTQGADTAKVLALMPYVILIMAFDGLRDFGATLSRAWERMEIESGIQIVTNVVIVGVSFLALAFSRTSESLAIGYTLGTATGMCIAFYPFRSYLRNIRSKISRELIGPILMASWPFGMIGLIGIINLNTDLVMLGWYRTLETVGYYSSAQKIAQLIQSIPGLLAIAFFPTMVKSIGTDRFRSVTERATRALFIIVIPITAIAIIYAQDIIYLLYGSLYLPAVRTFQVMSLTYVTAFLSSILGNALFALKEEKKLITYAIIGILANIGLNILFIPLFGASGAALSTVITSALLTAYLYIILKKKIPFSIFTRTGNIILASCAMIIIMLWVSTLEGFWMHVAGMLVGSGVFLGILWARREETLQEISSLFKRFLFKKSETETASQ